MCNPGRGRVGGGAQDPDPLDDIYDFTASWRNHQRQPAVNTWLSASPKDWRASLFAPAKRHKVVCWDDGTHNLSLTSGRCRCDSQIGAVTNDLRPPLLRRPGTASRSYSAGLFAEVRSLRSVAASGMPTRGDVRGGNAGARVQLAPLGSGNGPEPARGAGRVADRGMVQRARALPAPRHDPLSEGSVAMFRRSSVSRMRENRTYGLKGGWGNVPAQAPRP
jgi:hypothetical protein